MGPPPAVRGDTLTDPVEGDKISTSRAVGEPDTALPVGGETNPTIPVRGERILTNPVYQWEGERYKTEVFHLPEVDWREWESDLHFSPPFELSSEFDKVHPDAIQWLGDQTGWKDTEWVVMMVREGVRFGARGIPPGAKGSRGNSGHPEGIAFLKEKLLPDMLRLRQARAASASEALLARISPITMIPKSTDGEWRMIHDLSCVLVVDGRRTTSFNEATPHEWLPKVQLCRVEQVVATLLKLQALGFQDTIHLASIDLHAAYWQIRVHVSQLLWLGFMVAGVTYLFNGLAFGMKGSPSIFVRLFNVCLAYMRSLGILIYVYMDDALLIGSTFNHAHREIHVTLQVLLWCGFDINWLKSVIVPRRRLAFIGVIIDLDSWSLRIKDSTMTKARKSVESILRVRTWRSSLLVAELESLIGRMNFAALVVRRLLPLKHLLIGVKCHVETLSGDFYTPSPLARAYLHSVDRLLAEAKPWVMRDRQKAVQATYRHSIATDASEYGFGGWGFDVTGRVHYFYGSWEELGVPDGLIISDLELLAHFMAVEFLLPVLLPGVWAVDVAIDNQNACDWVNSLRCSVDVTKEQHLRRLEWLERYSLWVEKEGMDIRCFYLDTKANFRADALTRPHLFHLFFSDPVCSNAVRVQIPPSWWASWMR